MIQIKNIEKAYKGWTPRDLAYIKSVQFEYVDENYLESHLNIAFLSQFRTGIKLWPDFNSSFTEIVIQFKSVSNLKIKFSEKGMHQMSGFDIIDVSRSNWEDINFQIEDYENDTIKFCCKNIEIASISDKPFIFALS